MMPKIGNIVYKLIRNNVDDQKIEIMAGKTQVIVCDKMFKVDFTDLSKITKRLEQDDKKSMIL